MSLNDTPSGERIHIGFFGRRNAGKSSVVNAVTGQELAVVSDTKGTTTDPVSKAMELLPLGPVMIIDTPGFDDKGHLGELRVRKTKQILNRTDIAVLVIDATEGIKQCEEELLAIFKEKEIPYLLVYNKEDILSEEQKNILSTEQEGQANHICVSALEKTHINELKEKLARLVKTDSQKLQLVGDLVHPADLVVLVIPIDKAAPKGRLILPQQMVIREILDTQAISIVTQVEQLEATLNSINQKPKLIITDSQAFNQVAKIVPENISLTSFSILLARYKGTLQDALEGASMLEKLKDGDKVLISEGCTHHRQCDDIGTVKLPNWILKYTGRKIDFQFTSGGEFPKDLLKYKLIIHCGGCMLNEKTMQSRLAQAKAQGIPMTNYGIIISHLNGILERCTEML